MKVLFLDDDKYRHEQMLKQFAQLKLAVVAVYTAIEAIEWLRREKFRLILLDHDLDGTIYAPSGPGTGFEVAEQVAASVNRDTDVIVHSLNHVGAGKMVEVIGKNARWIPFYELPRHIDRMFAAR